MPLADVIEQAILGAGRLTFRPDPTGRSKCFIYRFFPTVHVSSSVKVPALPQDKNQILRATSA